MAYSRKPRKTPAQSPAPQSAARRRRKGKAGPSIAAHLSDMAGGNYVSGRMGTTFAGPPHTEESVEKEGTKPAISAAERARRRARYGNVHKTRISPKQKRR